MANVVSKVKKDYITDHDVMLVDLDSGERLHFQGLPLEIEKETDTVWATIRPYGRNNPHYHFVGSEDTLAFEVSWYATQENKNDVIDRAEWIVSLTKADGYRGRPHLVGLIWGDMYRKQKFIVWSAKYTMSVFDKPSGYKPTVIRQQIVLKRVTDRNLTLSQVLDWS